VKRRELTLGLLAIGIAIATQADAQSAASPLPRVVVIVTGDEAFFQPYRDGFLRGMRELGHVEGKTFRLEARYAHGEPARSVALIRDAIASRPDVLVVSGLTKVAMAFGIT
jgi:ABC-type sugar transport system substrate-binding protein